MLCCRACAWHCCAARRRAAPAAPAHPLALRAAPPAAQLLHVAFNQDQGCFAAGTDKGFRIYHCEPFKETFKRDFSSGGIGIVEMLFRCNILALVGGGPSPRFAPHKVMIWDDHQNRCIGELAFRSDVKAVKLRRDRVVVALAAKVYVYNFADLALLDHIETCDNPRGERRRRRGTRASARAASMWRHAAGCRIAAAAAAPMQRAPTDRQLQFHFVSLE